MDGVEGTRLRAVAYLLKFVGDEKHNGAGEREGNAVRAAACASLTPCASRARDGVMGDRAFANSRKGDESRFAWSLQRAKETGDGNRGVRESAESGRRDASRRERCTRDRSERGAARGRARTTLGRSAEEEVSRMFSGTGRKKAGETRILFVRNVPSLRRSRSSASASRA